MSDASDVGSESILLVEDNEDDVFFMRRALKGAGIRSPLQVVEDGQAAIDYLAGQRLYADRVTYPYPGTVFLDLKLPHKSGFEVLAWIQNQPGLERPLIIVLSSSNLAIDIERAMALGARDYLVKPPLPAMLLRLSERHEVSWVRSIGG